MINYDRSDEEKCESKEWKVRFAHIKVRLLSSHHSIQLPIILFPPEFWSRLKFGFGNTFKCHTHLAGSERQEWAAAISFILDSIFSCRKETKLDSPCARQSMFCFTSCRKWISPFPLELPLHACQDGTPLPAIVLWYWIELKDRSYLWPISLLYHFNRSSPVNPKNLMILKWSSLYSMVCHSYDLWCVIEPMSFLPDSDSASSYWPSSSFYAPLPVEQMSVKDSSKSWSMTIGHWYRPHIKPGDLGAAYAPPPSPRHPLPSPPSQASIDPWKVGIITDILKKRFTE